MGRKLVAVVAVALVAALIVVWQLGRSRRDAPAARPAPAPARASAGELPPPPGPRAVPREAPRTTPDGIAVPDFSVPEEPSPRGADPGARPSPTSALEDDAAMAKAEWLLDAGDLEAARVQAHAVLERVPGEPRMLRVVVLAACGLGGEKEARQYFPQVAAEDRDGVAAECRRHGLEL